MLLYEETINNILYKALLNVATYLFDKDKIPLAKFGLLIKGLDNLIVFIKILFDIRNE